MRPRRVAAIAWRDLRAELKGRQGLFVPAVLVALMLPTSLYKRDATIPGEIHVFGDVPAEVLEVPAVRQTDDIGLHFARDAEGVLRLHGGSINPKVREALDRIEPREAVAVITHLPAQQAPHRGFLLALLAASSLTGPVSASIGTERSRGTLTSLLTAAVTRGEVVMGKWLAWGGFGMLTTLAFTAVALWRDVVDPGLWLLAMASVPLALTAFGLWVVRRASDVVSATATALRLQPAALMVTGFAAFALGSIDPLLGAAVPLGGALLSAGDVWSDVTTAAPLVAAASTLSTCAVFLWATARDLSEHPPATPLAAGWPGAAMAAGAAALALWTPILGPELWRQAGNPRLTETLSFTMALAGAAATLGGWSLMRFTQHVGDRPFVDLRRPSPQALALAVFAGVALGLASAALGSFADPTTMLGAMAGRLRHAFVPTGGALWACLLLLTVEEVLFRGILAQQTGHVPASTAWAVVKAPLDPFAALVGGVLMAGVGTAGGVLAGLLCRGVALLVATTLPVSPTIGAVTSLAAAAVVFGLVWGKGLSRGAESTT